VSFPLGKPVGGDLRQGIVTLPFFYFLQNHSDPGRVLAALDNGNGSGESVGEIIAQVRKSDAMRQAAAEAQDFAGRSKAHLRVFPDGPYRRALEELAEFVVSRHV
jgi:geranylgeranyl pyrophosphate synthase